ncbi:MAG: PPC domain-containing protein, partial [Gammaproteobacteria bacterium]|nr:PPC domain-containing protein [Gammaproteobacteria bacterium]
MSEVTISSCNNADQNKKRCLLQASNIKPFSGIHYRKNNKFKSTLLTGLLLSSVFFTVNTLASTFLTKGLEFLSTGKQFLIEQIIPYHDLVYIKEMGAPEVAGAALVWQIRNHLDKKVAAAGYATDEQLIQEHGMACGLLGYVGCQMAFGHKIVKETVENSHSEKGSWNKSGGKDPAAPGNRVFKLDIVQSGSVTIDLSSLGVGEERVDTYFYLLDSHRNMIAYNDDHPDDSTLNSHLSTNLQKGTYYVVAATYQKGEKGDFEVTVAGAKSKFGFNGDRVEGEWIDSGGYGGYKDWQKPGNVVHQIEVRKSGEVQIDLSSEVDTYLYVLDSRKRNIVSNDDIDFPAGNLNSRVTIPLEEGTYYLVASTYHEHQKGDYRLAVAGNAQFTDWKSPPSIGLFRMTNLGIKPAPIKTDEVTKNSQIKHCSLLPSSVHPKHTLHPNDLCLDNKYIIQGTYLREVETNTAAPFRVEQKTNPQTGFPKYILKNSHRPIEQQETLIYEVTHYDISGNLIWGLSERISQQSNAEEGYYRWRYNAQGYPTLYEYGKNRQSNNKLEPLVSLVYNYQQIPRNHNVDKTFLDYIVEYTSSKAADLEKGSIYQLQYEPSKLDISAIIQTLKNGEKMPWAIGEVAYWIKIAGTSEHDNLCLELMRLDRKIVSGKCDPGRSTQKFHLESKNNSRVFSLQNKGHPGCV